MKALREHGPCPEHRRTFGPVAAVLGGVPEQAGLGYWEKEIGKAADLKALEDVGRMIKAVARRKLDPGDVQKLRILYRRRRNQFARTN